MTLFYGIKFNTILLTLIFVICYLGLLVYLLEDTRLNCIKYRVALMQLNIFLQTVFILCGMNCLLQLLHLALQLHLNGDYMMSICAHICITQAFTLLKYLVYTLVVYVITLLMLFFWTVGFLAMSVTILVLLPQIINKQTNNKLFFHIPYSPPAS